MSLDSVELLVNFENYFGISIPDTEAEKIGTVQEMVDCVAKHLRITDQGTPLKEEILTKVNTALLETGISSIPLAHSDLIFKKLERENEQAWKELSQRLSLRLPKPRKAEKGIVNAFLNHLSPSPSYTPESITMEDFILALCAENFDSLIDAQKIRNHYEILTGVAGILVRNMGVDCYDVRPKKSFTNDFGID